jgi:hypothetical protein
LCFRKIARGFAIVNEVTRLPLVERVRFYRRLAEKAHSDARNSRGTLRVAFTRSAARWELLASAAEQVAAGTLTETSDSNGFYGPSSDRDHIPIGVTRMSVRGPE